MSGVAWNAGVAAHLVSVFASKEQTLVDGARELGDAEARARLASRPRAAECRVGWGYAAPAAPFFTRAAGRATVGRLSWRSRVRHRLEIEEGLAARGGEDERDEAR